jgi:hypothetical protein
MALHLAVNTFATKLVSSAPLPVEGQWAAVRAGDNFRELLISNMYTELDHEVWLALWDPRPPAGPASHLVKRTLTEEQLDWLIANETRPTLLAGALRYNEPTEQQWGHLLSLKCATKLVGRIPAWICLTNELRLRAARLAGGHHLLDCMNDGLVDDDETRAWLSRWDEWAPDRGANSSLQKLLHTRPEIMDAFVFGHESLATVAAGSHLLTDPAHQQAIAGREPDMPYVWMALVANPVVSLDIVNQVSVAAAPNARLAKVCQVAGYRLNDPAKRPQVTEALDSISDPDVLAWLVNRACPRNDPHPQAGRPFVLVQLARNPHLDDYQAMRVRDGLCDWNIQKQLGVEAASAAHEALVANIAILRLVGRSFVSGSSYTPERPKPDERGLATLASWQSEGPDTPVGQCNAAYGWLCAAGTVANEQAWSVLLTLLADAEPDDRLGTLVDTANLLAT